MTDLFVGGLDMIRLRPLLEIQGMDLEDALAQLGITADVERAREQVAAEFGLYQCDTCGRWAKGESGLLKALAVAWARSAKGSIRERWASYN